MLYSINYNHWGERKIWYGVPGEQAELFDKVMKESAPELFVEQTDLLHQMITHMNPQFLIDRGIHVHTVHQNAGEFVITFPRSYHAGFNEGLNCAEAVNFAPPDWLKMGRLCLENYASVGRTCVFAHEELVMKMVFGAHKLSIGMCLATLDELSWIVARETEFRRRLSIAGVHASAFCRFEDIPDDERSCAVCCTTLFCSGLCCRHDGRMVCAQHVQQLCNECSLEQCCLKFRYTLEDLVPLVRHLTERTTTFFEWRMAVAELYARVVVVPASSTSVIHSATVGGDELANHDNNGVPPAAGESQRNSEAERVTQSKIDVHQMRSLADQWRNARFPHCEEIQRINQTMAQFERTVAAVRKVLKRKIRLRDQTRCQKADTRWEYAEMHSLRQQLVDSMFEDGELEHGIQDLCQRVEGWKSRANAALARPFAGVQSVDELCALVAEAVEEFNVKLEAEGLDRLKSKLACCQWLVNAGKIVGQIERHLKVKSEKMDDIVVDKADDDGDDELLEDQKLIGTRTLMKKNHTGKGRMEEQLAEEEEEDHSEQRRVELHELAKLVADGHKWSTDNDNANYTDSVKQMHAKLEHFLNSGTTADQGAADFLAIARQTSPATMTIDDQNGATSAEAVEESTPVCFEQARKQWSTQIVAPEDAGANGIACGGSFALGTADWVQSPAMDTFRAELELAQNAHDEFELLLCENSQKAFSLRTLEQLEHNFAQSLFERDGRRHGKVKTLLNGLNRFVERARTMFQKTVSYYTLFDIVAGRSDLPALIEGESMPLSLFTSTKYLENWRQLRPFVSRDQLLGHLQSIADQQCTLLHALRLTNEGRTPKETCSCARDTPLVSSRRQRMNCSATSSTAYSGRGATGRGGGDHPKQRKRCSLPSRTGGGTTSAVDTSPPTMVVDERRTTSTTTAMSSNIREGQLPGSGGGNVNLLAGLRLFILDNEMIPCFVCNAKLHVPCAQWDPFLSRLPAGVLLCQRCLRSRRPCIEDVEAACRSSSELPENCLERIVLQHLFNCSVNAFTQLRRLLHTIPKGTKQIEPNDETALKKWLTMVLSLEVTDIEAYEALAKSAYFDLFPLPDLQIQTWHHVRERMVDSQQLPIIFGHSLSGPSSALGSGGGRRTTNAGGKRRSTDNDTHRQASRQSLGGDAKVSNNKSSGCTSATSASFFTESLLSTAVSDSSPAKQQRHRSNGTGECTMMEEGGEQFVATVKEDKEMEGQQKVQPQRHKQQQSSGSGGSHMEKCAADFCLQPYSEFTRWIQCEAGCARWYHFCCVGISVRGVQQISVYCCYKCATTSTTDSTAAESTATKCSSGSVTTTITIGQQQPHSPRPSSKPAAAATV